MFIVYELNPLCIRTSDAKGNFVKRLTIAGIFDDKTETCGAIKRSNSSANKRVSTVEPNVCEPYRMRGSFAQPNHYLCC